MSEIWFFEVEDVNQLSLSRALIVSQVPPPTHGSTVMTKTLIETLELSSIQVHLTDRRFSREIVEVGKFSFSKLLSGIAMPFRLFRDLAKFKPDVVIFFCTNRTLSFIVDLALLTICKMKKSRVAFYLHTSGYVEMARKSTFWKLAVKRYFNHSSLNIFLSERLKNELLPVVGRCKGVVIGNTASAQIEEATIPYDAGHARRVVFLANLIPEKGALDFIDIAEFISVGRSDVVFQIAGAPGPSEYQQIIQERIGLSSANITYLGQLGENEKLALLSSSDVLLFPSTYRFEAQPLAIVEALACANAVVAYDSGAIGEILNPSVGGVVSAGDKDAMAKLLVNLLDNDSLLFEKQNNARLLYLSRLSRAQFARNWIQALEELGI